MCENIEVIDASEYSMIVGEIMSRGYAHAILLFFRIVRKKEVLAVYGKNEKGSHPFHVPNWSGQKMAYI
jgi:hypothetical protein